MAGEVKDPRRTIPRAVIGGIGIAAVVFLIVGAVTLGVLGPVSLGTDNVPLYRAGLLAAGVFGGAVVLLTAWTASVTELIGDLLAASRVAYAMGEARELPSWLICAVCWPLPVSSRWYGTQSRTSQRRD